MIDKYIGIPYVSHGRDFNGCDCFGLVQLFLKNEYDIEMPEINSYDDASNGAAVEGLISVHKPILAGEKKQTPQASYVALYRYRGMISHMGVCIDRHRILHIMKGINSVIVPTTHPFLRGRLEGYYELR